MCYNVVMLVVSQPLTYTVFCMFRIFCRRIDLRAVQRREGMDTRFIYKDCEEIFCQSVSAYDRAQWYLAGKDTANAKEQIDVAIGKSMEVVGETPALVSYRRALFDLKKEVENEMKSSAVESTPTNTI